MLFPRLAPLIGCWWCRLGCWQQLLSRELIYVCFASFFIQVKGDNDQVCIGSYLIFLTLVCSGQLSDNVKGICTILVWLLSMGDSLCSNCCLTGALLIGNEKLLPIRCTRIVWAWWPLCLPRRVSLFCKKTLTFCYKSQISPASPDRTVTTFVYVSYASVC
jgi:hypothetical protein